MLSISRLLLAVNQRSSWNARRRTMLGGIRAALLKKGVGRATAGSLVLYFLGSDWRHIGTVDALDRVVSQWGTFPVYEHGFFEVPQSYGDTVDFFNMPAVWQSLADFLDYARSEGVSDEDIEAIIAELKQHDS